MQPVDKNDLVGYLRRQIRTYLRGLTNPERNALIGNFSQLDPEVALAILEMPPALSGALATDHAQLLDRALEAQHGEAITELQQLEQGIEIAERAVDAARKEIVRETGVDPATFDRTAAPFVKAATAPWLQKFFEDGKEVIRCVKLREDGSGGVLAIATPEEVASGIYFENVEAWRRAQAGDVAA